MNEITAYAIYDVKAEIYDTPVYFLKEEQAKRWFHQLCMKGEGRFEYFKNEMELHRIHKFNVINGKVFEAQVKKIMDGIQLGKEKENEISNETSI